MRRGAACAAALLAAAACSRGKPPAADARSARDYFLAGVEAHLHEDDAEAARDWALCLGKAEKGGDDELDCRLFTSMLDDGRKAPAPDERGEARRAYLEGRDHYLRGDRAGADRLWHDCLAASDRDPASRPDCLMAVELTAARRKAAPPAPELLAKRTGSSTAPDGKK